MFYIILLQARSKDPQSRPFQQKPTVRVQLDLPTSRVSRELIDAHVSLSQGVRPSLSDFKSIQW